MSVCYKFEDMEYRFYQRKETGISKKELNWIDNNLEKISQKEKVLFLFQAENETLIVTTKSIYLPFRDPLINLKYQQINTIKIVGDLFIEITNKNIEKITIDFVNSIDKSKLSLILNLLLKNNRINVETSIEKVERLFNEFNIIKSPPNQAQHKIPKVYLKQFGYLNNEQWMVSVIQRGEDFSRQKSIDSFTAETNVFDIESEDERFPRMFESLNSEIENLYPEMLADIDEDEILPDKCWGIIVQLTPNMMVRSDYWRDIVRNILESKNKNGFLEIIISIHSKSYKDLNNLKKKQFYKVISEGKITNSKLNRILLLFLNYLFHHLKELDLIILEAPTDKQFFTSDNPVNFNPNQEKGKLGFFSKNTEVYFPLSSKYLAYFHFRNSNTSNPILRKLKNRGVYKVTKVMSNKEYDNLIKKEIIEVPSKLLIAPGEFILKKKKNE